MINDAMAKTWLYWLLRVLPGLSLLLVLATPSPSASALTPLAAPTLQLVRGETAEAAPLISTGLAIDIVGHSARVELRQVFTNPGSQWVHGVYRLPLPDQAAVQGLVIEFEGRRIVGEIRERVAAQQVFQQAASEGRRASLLEHGGDDAFSLQVANIPPGGDVTVTVRLTLSAVRHGDWFSLRFPTTYTPPYAHAIGDEASQRAVSTPVIPWRAEPSALAQRLDWRVSLRSHGPLASVVTPYHASQRHWQGDTLEIRPRGALPAMDRDFVLKWRRRPSATPEPTVLVERHEDGWFAELALLPPQPDALPAVLPRDLLLVLDVSGSMAGEPLRQAIAATRYTLSTLRPIDRFELITFASDVTPLFDDLVPVTPANRRIALEFLDQLEAGGGTEMLPALAAAVAYPTGDVGVLRQILFITDGAVYGETALLSLLDEGLGDARLFTVAIGAAPNTRFMRRAAERGRGLHRHIGNLGEVGEVLDDLLAVMAQPVVTDLYIDWPLPTTTALPAPADLYAGEPILQRVSLDDYVPGAQILVSGTVAGAPWQRAVSLPSVPADLVVEGVVAARWAESRIDWLMDSVALAGLDPDAVREEVLSLGLRHGLVTPFTSFVAVAEVLSRPPWADAGTFRVPTLAPAGTTAFAQTATGAGLLLYLGLAGLLAGTVVLALTREDP